MDYFHEFYPDEARQETVIYYASKESFLPEGYYAFLESYCSNPECDCKEVLIQIEPQSSPDPLYFERSARPTAVLKYTWEELFSKKNPVIHQEAPKSPLALIALKLFREYVETHSSYLMNLSKHYSMMKKIDQNYELSSLISSPIKKEIKPGRNELCSCGSGKKFKKCCLNK
jgi:hypothetical protein